jgi:hypothetical protein
VEVFETASTRGLQSEPKLLTCPVYQRESEFLDTDPEVPYAIPGATRFSEK